MRPKMYSNINLYLIHSFCYTFPCFSSLPPSQTPALNYSYSFLRSFLHLFPPSLLPPSTTRRLGNETKENHDTESSVRGHAKAILRKVFLNVRANINTNSLAPNESRNSIRFAVSYDAVVEQETRLNNIAALYGKTSCLRLALMCEWKRKFSF